MALIGTFEDMPFIDLILVFEVGRKSGFLKVEREGLCAYVYVSCGRLIDATIQELPSQRVLLSGDQAIVNLIKWVAGQFIFFADDSVVRHAVTIFSQSEELIQQGSALLDETPDTNYNQLSYRSVRAQPRRASRFGVGTCTSSASAAHCAQKHTPAQANVDKPSPVNYSPSRLLRAVINRVRSL